MNTNYIFRRILVVDPLIRRFSKTSRLPCFKNSDDKGKSDNSEPLLSKNKLEDNIKDEKKGGGITDFLAEDNKKEDTENLLVNKGRFAEVFEKLKTLKFSEENELQNKKEAPGDLFTSEKKLDSFATAFDKFAKLEDSIRSGSGSESGSDSDSEKEQQTFTSLLRNSKFIDLGDPEGKVVTGSIYHIVGNDLYIDFGWKFPTVCPRPLQGGENYIRGAKVRLLIKDLELSTRFLGSTTDITLREADCVLLGLAKSKVRNL